MSRLYDCVFSDKLCSAFCSNRNLLNKKFCWVYLKHFKKPLEIEISSHFATVFRLRGSKSSKFNEMTKTTYLNKTTPWKALTMLVKCKIHVGGKVCFLVSKTVKPQFVGGNVFQILFVSEPLHIQFLLICNSNTRGKYLYNLFSTSLFSEINISRLPISSVFLFWKM